MKRCLALDDLLLVDVVRNNIDDVCRFERCEPVEFGLLLVNSFLLGFDDSDYWGALAFSDDDWSAKQVADVTHVILDHYDEPSLNQFNAVGREWLSRR